DGCALPGRLQKAPGERVLGREGDRVDGAVQRSPALGELGGERLEVGVAVDVELEHVGRGGQAPGGALGQPAGAAEAGEQDLGARALRPRRDRVGDRVAVDDAGDEDPLPRQHQRSTGSDPATGSAPAAASPPPYASARSDRARATRRDCATARPCWLSTRIAMRASAVDASSGRTSATSPSTWIVSPMWAGRLNVTVSAPRRATTRSGSSGISPIAYESTSMPWAILAPKRLRPAHSASACCGCQSPVRAANETTSASVMVRPRVLKRAPGSSLIARL